MPFTNPLEKFFTRANATAEPASPMWEVMEDYLREPDAFLSAHFVNVFQALTQDPAYADRLSTMTARGAGLNHVFVRVTPEGGVDLLALTPRATITDWHFKPDGQIRCDLEFRDITQGGPGRQVRDVIMQCFDDLSGRSGIAEIIAKARAAFVSDAPPSRNPSAFDNLVYR